MADSWLIRTSENKIFGPVSSTKILDLIASGSLKKSDELSAGNGYWIFVKESDLVLKFIREKKTQPFNPINEANYVDISSYEMDFVDQGQSAKFPEAEDLEYPDIESAKGSVMGKVNTSSDEQEMTFEKKQSLPSEDDLDYPSEEPMNDSSDPDSSFKKITFDIDELKPVAKTEEPSENFPKGEDSEYPD